MKHALTILSLFVAAWFLPSSIAMTLLLVFSVGVVICDWLWGDKHLDNRARDDFREHLAHPQRPVVRESDELDGAA